ncbi:hypothetical protein M758_1G025100 [Ceratodon purpureus]|nr:hypothetical protein M758_1G025100 [Ceratodon purpureus]
MRHTFPLWLPTFAYTSNHLLEGTQKACHGALRMSSIRRDQLTTRSGGPVSITNELVAPLSPSLPSELAQVHATIFSTTPPPIATNAPALTPLQVMEKIEKRSLWERAQREYTTRVKQLTK